MLIDNLMKNIKSAKLSPEQHGELAALILNETNMSWSVFNAFQEMLIDGILIELRDKLESDEDEDEHSPFIDDEDDFDELSSEDNDNQWK